jgi:hypothetical protein
MAKKSAPKKMSGKKSGKKSSGKKMSGKKSANPWIEHVKAFARKHGINYAEALKHSDLKKGYRK